VVGASTDRARWLLQQCVRGRSRGSKILINMDLLINVNLLKVCGLNMG